MKVRQLTLAVTAMLGFAACSGGSSQSHSTRPGDSGFTATPATAVLASRMVTLTELPKGWTSGEPPEQAPASARCAPGLRQAAFVDFRTTRTDMQESVLDFRNSRRAQQFVAGGGFTAHCPTLTGTDEPFKFEPQFTASLPLKINAAIHSGATDTDKAYRVYFHVGPYAAQLLFNGDPTQDQVPPVIAEIEAAVVACMRHMTARAS